MIETILGLMLASTPLPVIELQQPGSRLPPEVLRAINERVNGPDAGALPAFLPVTTEPAAEVDVSAALGELVGARGNCERSDPERLAAAIAVLRRDANARGRSDLELAHDLLAAYACRIKRLASAGWAPIAFNRRDVAQAFRELAGDFPDLGGNFTVPPEELLPILYPQFVNVRKREAVATITIADRDDTQDAGSAPRSAKTAPGPHTTEAVYFDGHFVGNAPLSLKTICGKHWLRIGDATRLLEIDVGTAGARVDPTRAWVALHASTREGVVRLDYGSHDALAQTGTDDAAWVAARMGALRWLTVQATAEGAEVQVCEHARHTVKTAAALADLTEVTASLVNTAVNEAVISPVSSAGAVALAPGKVSLVVESGRAARQFFASEPSSSTAKAGPFEFPTTLQVLPGHVLISVPVTGSDGSPIDVNVPDTGALVRLDPGSPGRLTLGKWLGGAGTGLFLLTAILGGVLQSGGSNVFSFRGDTGAPSDASFLLPMLLGAAALVAAGVPLIFSGLPGVDSLEPLPPTSREGSTAKEPSH